MCTCWSSEAVRRSLESDVKQRERTEEACFWMEWILFPSWLNTVTTPSMAPVAMNFPSKRKKVGKIKTKEEEKKKQNNKLKKFIVVYFLRKEEIKKKFYNYRG